MQTVPASTWFVNYYEVGTHKFISRQGPYSREEAEFERDTQRPSLYGVIELGAEQ
jgi:hypothetical protein